MKYKQKTSYRNMKTNGLGMTETRFYDSYGKSILFLFLLKQCLRELDHK